MHLIVQLQFWFLFKCWNWNLDHHLLDFSESDEEENKSVKDSSPAGSREGTAFIAIHPKLS